MHGLKVFIVEDSSTVAMVLTRIIESRVGWRVVGHAADCREAADMIGRDPPDVVTLDLSLPDGNAFELLSALVTRAMPVVVVSGSVYEGSPVTAEALRCGAEACFDKAKIRDQVEDFLGALADAAHCAKAPEDMQKANGQDAPRE